MRASDRVVPTVSGATLRPGTKVRMDGHGRAWLAPPSLVPEPMPALCDDAVVAAGLARFASAAAPQRAALLDVRAPGSGRDASALARAASRSGVAIAAVTGFTSARAYPLGLRPWTTADSALATFLRELDGGFREAPMARAAALVATFDDPTPEADACWEAAIAAARETDALMAVQVTDGRAGVAALAWLGERGVRAERCYLLGADRGADSAPLDELAAAGALVGVAAALRDQGGADLVAALVGDGRGGAIALGLDLAAADWHADVDRGPATLVTAVEAGLRARGVPDDALDAMLGGSLLQRMARPEVIAGRAR